MLGHLIAFVAYGLLYALVRLVLGHAVPLVWSLVLTLPCEVGGMMAAGALRRWTRG